MNSVAGRYYICVLKRNDNNYEGTHDRGHFINLDRPPMSSYGRPPPTPAAARRCAGGVPCAAAQPATRDPRV